MIVLFDANVLISGLTTSSLCLEIIEAAIKEHEPLTSPVIVEEARRSLSRKFPQHTKALQALDQFRLFATVADPPPLAEPTCRDPDDDWVLAAPIAGKADVIVTGDEDLLVLEKHQGIPIVTPRGFLEMISGQSS